jgi:hypothetical protein
MASTMLPRAVWGEGLGEGLESGLALEFDAGVGTATPFSKGEWWVEGRVEGWVLERERVRW